MSTNDYNTPTEAQPADYFFQRVNTLEGFPATNGNEWPLRGIRVNGYEMSQLERTLYGLVGVIELIHAECDNKDAVAGGHIHAQPGLGLAMHDRLLYAAGVLAKVASRALAEISERAQDGEEA